MPDNIWADYLDKLRQLENAVKLTASLTQETAKATEEVCKQVEIVAKNMRQYLEKTRTRD